MEVTVLDAKNTPKKPVIAIRVGSALKHAPLAVNKPFHVPSSGVQDAQVNISLYQHLGTQTIPDADEAESMCNVPVRAPNGTCTQVKLRIRRGQTNAGLANAKRNDVGVEDYLNRHQLEARLHSLFEIVLKRQPLDPYRCMIEELQKERGPEIVDAAEAPTAPVPKVPVAPAAPRPENARPSPAALGRNVKPSEPENSAEDDAATKAALAEVRSSQDSDSPGAPILLGQRLSSEEVESTDNRTDANKIMSLQSGQSNAIEDREKNRAVSQCVVGMVMRGAHAVLTARSLGLRSGSWDGVHTSANSEENKILSKLIRTGTFRKASSSQETDDVDEVPGAQ